VKPGQFIQQLNNDIAAVKAERDELNKTRESEEKAAGEKFDNFAEHAYTTLCIALDDMVVHDRLAAHEDMFKFLGGCGFPGEAPIGRVDLNAWFADHYSFPDVAEVTEDEDWEIEGSMDPGLSVGNMFQVAMSHDCRKTELQVFSQTQEGLVQAIEELSTAPDPRMELQVYFSLMMVWSKRCLPVTKDMSGSKGSKHIATCIVIGIFGQLYDLFDRKHPKGAFRRIVSIASTSYLGWITAGRALRRADFTSKRAKTLGLNSVDPAKNIVQAILDHLDQPSAKGVEHVQVSEGGRRIILLVQKDVHDEIVFIQELDGSVTCWQGSWVAEVQPWIADKQRFSWIVHMDPEPDTGAVDLICYPGSALTIWMWKYHVEVMDIAEGEPSSVKEEDEEDDEEDDEHEDEEMKDDAE